MSRPWTSQELRFLERNKGRGLEAIAQELGRPLYGVRNMSTKLFRRQHRINFGGYKPEAA